MNNVVASAKIKFLDWYLAAGAESRPSGWSIALHSGDPGVYGDQNELTTSDDLDYERKEVTWRLPVSFVNGTSLCLNNEDLIWTPDAGASFEVAALSVRDENGAPIAWGIFSEVTEVSGGGEPFRIYADSLAIVIDDICQNLRESVLLYLFSTESMTQATGIVAALHTDNPGPEGADNEVTLAQDADYVRKAVTFSSSAENPGTGKVKITSDWASWTPAAASLGYTVTWTTYRDATGNCLVIAQRMKEMVMAAGVPSPGTTGEILAY